MMVQRSHRSSQDHEDNVTTNTHDTVGLLSPPPPYEEANARNDQTDRNSSLAPSSSKDSENEAMRRHSSIIEQGSSSSEGINDSIFNPQPPPVRTTSASKPDSSRHAASRQIQKARVKPRRVIGNYSLTTTLGSGAMGKVKLAVHNITHEKLAVKIVPRAFATEASTKDEKEKDENREIRTIREASIMLLLYHPYIVSLKEMVVLDPYYYLFMEYVGGGQLLDYIISHGKLKEKHARRFARQIVSALDYCHRNSIVHRDLKIENILISQSGNVKIIDFGLSNLFSPRSHLSTFCGSLYFAAPELLNAKAYTGPEVDVWSFGIVLYVLVCGKVPFDDQSMPALHAKIKRGHVEYPSHLSSECKNLLSRMLVINPNHRATISEIIAHPWMNRGYDSLVDNHLPNRAPLTLPVDTEVISNMTGFGFGTEAEIKQQLETIITSEEYQKAAKTLAKRSNTHQHHHNPLSASRLSHHSPIPSRKSHPLPNDDPQSIPAAYHPLVSIYYLVKERIERERRSFPIGPTDTRRLSQGSIYSAEDPVTVNLKIPDIPVPEVAHATDARREHSPFARNDGTAAEHDGHGIFGRGTPGVALGKRGKTNIRIDDDGHIIEADKPNILETGLQRLMPKPFGRTSESSSAEDDNNEKEHRGMFRRLSHAFHRRASIEGHRRQKSQNSTDMTSPTAALGPMPIPLLSDKANNSTKKTSTASEEDGKKVEPGSSISYKVSHLLNRAGSTNQAEGRSRRPRQATVSGPNPLAEERVASGKAPAQTLPPFSESSSNDGKRDEKSHIHQQEFPQGVGQGFSSPRSQGTADETVKQVFLKGLFSVTTTSTKHPSVIRADLIRVLERIGVKWRESKGRFECVHMPSIDMKRVVGRHSADNATGSSSSAASPVTVPDLIVRFEIYIVKVSWLLGMHGLQFRRVSGDPWLYKNMCSRILAELKL